MERVAWALEGSPDSLELIITWPGGGNRTSQKVPSTISYKDGDMKWGVLRALKLLLDEGQGMSYDPARESKNIINKMNKDTVDIVGEYLQRIVSHSTQLLERRFGNTLNCMELKYVLTVPAVWSDRAKTSTLRAGISAGIPASNVSLVSEPEAAAL
ncbi:Hsp70 protein [Aspergillus sclerotialis]|uniref:Hsp70 protein n=1 Tax=Aspergillus sclerotialis TaxID=2070753 RepID=A0A3A2Z897_9EURO|nr:Hsp70 protein [Aspergillus sclerotialis]